MFADLAFLWRFRERPTTLRRCLRVYAKRALHALALIRLLMRAGVFRLRGADVGRFVVFGRCQVDGPMTRLSVGDETAFGRCEISLHDAVRIGKRVVVNDGARLLTGSHSLRHTDWSLRTGAICLGDYVWVATDAIILPGVTIGEGAVIGAGAVVREDVPAYALAIGNPAAIHVNGRQRGLEYSPALLVAAIEAWVGH